jgi:hypothetical protein
VEIGQVCYQYKLDFNNAVTLLNRGPYDVLLIAGIKSVDEILKTCGGNARLKILMIDISDESCFNYYSEFSDCIDKEGKGMGLTDEVLDKAMEHNLPILIIDSTDRN